VVRSVGWERYPRASPRPGAAPEAPDPEPAELHLSCRVPRTATSGWPRGLWHESARATSHTGEMTLTGLFASALPSRHRQTS